MRCLHCGQDGLPPTAENCPRCRVHLPTLMRDLLTPGTLLHEGKYRLEFPLGRGGFGVTYQASHALLNQRVAIKEFYPREIAFRDSTGHLLIPETKRNLYQRGLHRFLREGQILATLNHPGIVRVQDFFEEHETAYLVMELVVGQTLRNVLQHHPQHQLSDPVAKDIVTKLVQALNSLHKQGVYHLDIKPDNILITPDHRVVLIDFGASRQGLGGTTTLAFTPDYAAPELLAGRPVGPETDLFELGMMIHELLTGQLPPPAMSRMMQQDWIPALEAPWQDLVAVALQVNRANRPQDVAAWWQASMTLPPLVDLDLIITQPISVPDEPVIQTAPDAPTLLSDQVQILSEPPIKASTQSIPTQLDPLPEPDPPRSNPRRYWKLGIGGLGVLIAMVAVIGLSPLNVLIPSSTDRLSPDPAIASIQALRNAQEYDMCIEQATSLITQATAAQLVLPSLLADCQLGRATQLAHADRLEEALALVQVIPPSVAAYRPAQQQLKTWSNQLLRLATDQYHQGHLTQALTLLQTIPQASPRYPVAQDRQQQWTQEWQRNQQRQDQAQRSLNQGNPQAAIESAQMLSVESRYWKQQQQQLIDQAQQQGSRVETSFPLLAVAQTFIKALITGILVAAPVSPISALCIQSTLTIEARVGVAVGLGAATSEALYSSIVGFQLIQLEQVLLGQQEVLLLLGSLVTGFLGLQSFTAQPDFQFQHRSKIRTVLLAIGFYGLALLISGTDPVAIQSFERILGYLQMGRLDQQSATVLVVGIFMGSGLWWVVVTEGANWIRQQFQFGTLNWIYRTSGAVLIGFSLWTIIQFLFNLNL